MPWGVETLHISEWKQQPEYCLSDCNAYARILFSWMQADATHCKGFLCYQIEDGSRIHQYMPANIARDFIRKSDLAILEYVQQRG